MMRDAEVLEIITPYLAVFPYVKMDAGGFRVMARLLSHVKREDLIMALDVLVRKTKYFPSIAEILETVEGINTEEPKSAFEAWQEVMRLAQEFHVYKTWVYSSDEVKAAAEQFGRMELCLLQTDEINTARAQFVRIYNDVCARKKKRAEIDNVRQLYGEKVPQIQN